MTSIKHETLAPHASAGVATLAYERLARNDEDHTEFPCPNSIGLRRKLKV
jgi:hypothetical protein